MRLPYKIRIASQGRFEVLHYRCDGPINGKKWDYFPVAHILMPAWLRILPSPIKTTLLEEAFRQRKRLIGPRTPPRGRVEGRNVSVWYGGYELLPEPRAPRFIPSD